MIIGILLYNKRSIIYYIKRSLDYVYKNRFLDWFSCRCGSVAGAFGYKYMQNRVQQQPVIAEGQEQVSMEELVRQKEALEDMIAAQQAAEIK